MNYTVETSDITRFDNDIVCQRTFHDDILKLEEWFKNGLLHREGEKENDLPSWIMYGDGGMVKTKIWHKNGLVYRDNGLPALISYFDDGLLRHEEWYNEAGQRHREGDLPASIRYSEFDGSPWLEEWYENDVCYSEHRRVRDD